MGMGDILQQAVQPKEIKKIGTSELKILWSDGHESLYPFSHLRKHCQCALCIDEWSGKALLDRKKVSEHLEGTSVSLVGQYAIRVDFSDGHNTGIYAFKHLREICPCKVCGQGVS